MVRYAGLSGWLTAMAEAVVAVVILAGTGCVVQEPHSPPGYPDPSYPHGPQGPQGPNNVHPLDREPVRPNQPRPPQGPNRPSHLEANADTNANVAPVAPIRLDTPWLDPSVAIGAFSDVQMDLPPDLRTRNWGGGSCVHASTVNLLYWQGQEEMAEWWRKTYIGGEYANRLIQRLESAGLRYAYTTKGDFEFLKWCCRTRRGAGIFYKPSHSINCVGIDQQYVYLLDNNATQYPEQRGHYERVPVQQFVSEWKNRYGGFAWTLVYNPPPPNPVVVQRWWDVPQYVPQ